MKSLKIALLVIIAVVFVLPSCKKGKDDPFISFKSRDARVTANWKLTKIEGTTVSSPLTTTYSYDGSNFTKTTNSTPVQTTTGVGTFEMEIVKDGSMTFSESYTLSGSTSATVSTGTLNWLWYDSKKDKVNLELSGISSSSKLFMTADDIYYVDELKGKEMILKVTSTNTSTTGTATPTTSSTDLTYTFEKQK